jgi:hypothetical protein
MNKNPFDYCCPGCGNSFKENESLYNMSSVIFPGMAGTSIPVYLKRQKIEEWIDETKNAGHIHEVWAPSLNDILVILNDDINSRIWSDTVDIPKSNELYDEDHNYIYNHSISSFDQHYRNLVENYVKKEYKFRIKLDDSLRGFSWKTYINEKLHPNQNRLFNHPERPNGLHCPQCKAVVLEDAFKYEQKIVGFIGLPGSGKTCMFLALGSEMFNQGALPLEFKSEDHLLNNLGVTLTGSVDSITPQRNRDRAKIKEALEKLTGSKNFQDEVAILELYRHGYHFDPTAQEGNNVFDLSFRVGNKAIGIKDTIYTFVDISGEMFSGVLSESTISNNFPLFRNCDLFIFCVEKDNKKNEQNTQMVFLQRVIEQIDMYLTVSSDKVLRPTMCALTKYDEWRDEWEKIDGSKIDNNVNSTFIKNVFGFIDAYRAFYDPMINCGMIIDKLSNYLKVTPLYCSAYGLPPIDYSSILHETDGVTSRVKQKIEPINIDIIIKWIYFATGRCEYGSGVSRNDNNPMPLSFITDYHVADLNIFENNISRTEEQIYNLNDLLVLGELFCNIKRDIHEKYLTSMWNWRFGEVYKKQSDALHENYEKHKSTINTNIMELESRMSECIENGKKQLETFDSKTDDLISSEIKSLEDKKDDALRRVKDDYEAMRKNIKNRKLLKEHDARYEQTQIKINDTCVRAISDLRRKATAERNAERDMIVLENNVILDKYKDDLKRLQNSLVSLKAEFDEQTALVLEQCENDKKLWFKLEIWNEEVMV